MSKLIIRAISDAGRSKGTREGERKVGGGEGEREKRRKT